MGFVFIEANVKKWGLAPQTGSLAPPPPYGSEAGSILIETGREGVREGQGSQHFSGWMPGHGRTNSQQVRLARGHQPTSPGPQRSPTDISLAQLSLVDSREENDAGEGTSTGPAPRAPGLQLPAASVSNVSLQSAQPLGIEGLEHHDDEDDDDDQAPPDYESPEGSPERHRRKHGDEEREPLVQHPSPPIPSYETAIAESRSGTPRRKRNDTQGSRS